MATHDANIENLRTATLGEQVRGSMIQLFEEDYNLVKRGITVGTDVTSASSSTEGYYDGNVYINNETLDIWKLLGDVWTRQGNLKGISEITAVESSADDGQNVITFELTDGTQITVNVKNGSKGSTGVSVTGAVDNGDGTFYLRLSDGSRTENIQTIQGLKGDKGDKGDKGNTGEKGRSVDTIVMTGTGKQHPITVTFSDGTSQLIGVINDGNDGDGTGNMHTDTYDPTKSGIVNSARALSDGTNTIPVSSVMNKADQSTSLRGYGIEDAYDKTEIDNMFAEVASDWSSVTDKPFDTLGNDFQTKTVGDNKQLALSEDVTTKLQNLDDNGKIDASNVKYGDTNVSEELQKGIEYSTNEVAVGKWIDGKTIYRKSFMLNIIGQNSSAAHGITFSKGIKMYGGIQHGGEFLPLSFYYSSTDWGRVWMNPTYIRYGFGSTGLVGDMIILTFEYLK